LQDFTEKLKIWSRFFSAFYLFSPISQRVFNGLDKLTNGVTDNQGVKLPKNKEREQRTRTTKRKKEKIVAVVVMSFV